MVGGVGHVLQKGILPKEGVINGDQTWYLMPMTSAPGGQYPTGAGGRSSGVDNKGVTVSKFPPVPPGRGVDTPYTGILHFGGRSPLGGWTRIRVRSR